MLPLFNELKAFLYKIPRPRKLTNCNSGVLFLSVTPGVFRLSFGTEWNLQLPLVFLPIINWVPYFIPVFYHLPGHVLQEKFTDTAKYFNR